MDDFGVKYTKLEDAKHLIKTVMDRYEGKVSWDPDYYLGMTMEWDYIKRTCKLSMPEYVKQALCRFQHIMKQKCYSPSPFTPPIYGKKQQMAKIDNSMPITPEEKKLLQQVCGTFLYYARAVDCTMLHALNDLATRVNDGTQETINALQHFLNYCATNPESTVLFQASDMVLQNHSDAAYLVVSIDRARVRRYIFLGNKE